MTHYMLRTVLGEIKKYMYFTKTSLRLIKASILHVVRLLRKGFNISMQIYYNDTS